MPDMSSYWNPASMIAPGCPTPKCPTPVESVHSSPSASPRSPMAGSPSSDDKPFSSVPMIYQHILQSPADQTTTFENSELPKICQVQSIASPICKTPTKAKLKGKKVCVVRIPRHNLVYILTVCARFLDETSTVGSSKE